MEKAGQKNVFERLYPQFTALCGLVVAYLAGQNGAPERQFFLGVLVGLGIGLMVTVLITALSLYKEKTGSQPGR